MTSEFDAIVASVGVAARHDEACADWMMDESVRYVLEAAGLPELLATRVTGRGVRVTCNECGDVVHEWQVEDPLEPIVADRSAPRFPSSPRITNAVCGHHSLTVQVLPAAPEAPDERNEWSVLRPNLLQAATQHLYAGGGSTLDDEQGRMSRVRTLFNTWHNSGAVTVVPAAQSDVWRDRYGGAES